MIEQQQKLILSPYIEICELVVSKDNLLRQIKELVDFEFTKTSHTQNGLRTLKIQYFS